MTLKQQTSSIGQLECIGDVRTCRSSKVSRRSSSIELRMVVSVRSILEKRRSAFAVVTGHGAANCKRMDMFGHMLQWCLVQQMLYEDGLLLVDLMMRAAWV